MYRSFDYETLDEVCSPYKAEWIGFDAKEIVGNPDNILITDGDKNFGLFMPDEEPGAYVGHYLFTSRGKKAYNVALRIIDFFLTNYPVDVIIGYTPVEHKGAIGMNKLLGFTFHEIVETEAGPLQKVSLQKDDFYG